MSSDVETHTIAWKHRSDSSLSTWEAKKGRSTAESHLQPQRELKQRKEGEAVRVGVAMALQPSSPAESRG